MTCSNNHNATMVEWDIVWCCTSPPTPATHPPQPPTHPTPPPPSLAAAPGETQGLQISTASGNFTFNNANLTYDAAESDCRAQGGHLASYSTLFEQQDVEDFLVNNVGPRSSLGDAGMSAGVLVSVLTAQTWPASLLQGVRKVCLMWRAALAAGHPDPHVPLPPDLLAGPQGGAKVPQLHMAGPQCGAARPHRGRRQRLGHQPCWPARARQDRGLRPGTLRRAAGQPGGVRLGVRGLHRHHGLHLQDVQ